MPKATRRVLSGLKMQVQLAGRGKCRLPSRQNRWGAGSQLTGRDSRDETPADCNHTYSRIQRAARQCELTVHVSYQHHANDKALF